MTFRRLSLRAFGLCVLPLLLAAFALAAQNRAPSLAEADRLYGEKSYAAALKAYEQLLVSARITGERLDEIHYRVAVCLGKTKQWDRALTEGLEFVKNRRGTVWEPRGLYWLGRLYLAVPHQGYRVGTKFFRGSDVPQNHGDARPEQVYLHEQDRQNAQDALEAARVLFAKFREPHGTARDEIQLNFDVARVLLDSPDFDTWAAKRAWAPPADPAWKVTGAEPYALDWAPPKKILFLYEQIGRLAPRQHSAALALLGKALWLRGYHAQMRQQYALRWEGERQVRIPYPYEDLSAEAALRQLVREFPDDPVRDQAQVTIGFFLQEDGKFLDAVREYRRFLEERPESKWTADARFRVQEITRATLALHTGGPQTAGQPATLQLSTRNLKEVRLEAFRVDLEAVLARPERLTDPNTQFAHFERNFGSLEAARRFYGPRVANWTVATRDRGDHHPVGLPVETPLKEAGAYVVEAQAPGLQAATVVVVTDLVIVQKLHRDGALLFAANARTGKPVRDTRLVVKQTWQEGPQRRAEGIRAITDADGIASVPLRRGPNRSNFQLETLARKDERYALTQPHWTQDYSDNPGLFRVYSVTDRAVYRPQQTVHYRQMVMRRQGGDWRPVTDRHVKVEVHDPRGERIFERTETAGTFGSVSGTFELPEDAPLGEYQILATIPSEQVHATQHGGNRFRVEEYKKPEFEVTVTPAAERVRLGDPTSVQVRAAYYFGGPVPGAKVTYRVYRSPYAQRYRFPRPFDFLQRHWSEGDYDVNYRNGEVVAQGEARLDEKGEAKVSFPTRAEDARWRGQDLSYTVEADVQDASRRTISGSGAVKATRHDVAVFLNFPRGYASQGDHLDVEVVTLNPSDQPVSVAGTAKVYRQPERDGAKETLVHEEPLKTDRHGRATLRWTADAGGYFRVAFETRDTAEQEVAGSTMVWVQGPELERGRFLYRGVFLVVKEPYYEEGQTAKVLLVTPAPDCAVLVTRQANNEVQDRRLVAVRGRSLELDVPLARRDVPNVYLSAVLVRDGQLFAAEQELFVPPVRQFASVTVSADRERYRPGEKARLQLQARDAAGRPLRAELSVAVTDASLAYIQKDYAPDVRVFYYGDRRSQSVQATGSPGFHFSAQVEDRQPRQTFATHEWLLPEGMGQLPEWPGAEHGYARQNFSYFGGYAGRRYRLGERMAGGAGGMLADFDRASRFEEREMAQNASALGAALPAAAPGPARPDQPQEGLAAAQLRSRFLDTAFWTPAVVTNEQGQASVEVTWPDNLTEWRAVAVGSTATAQVGAAETKVRVKKDVIVRLQAPRFFVERDRVTVSANVHNYLDRAARAKVTLRLEGDTAELESRRAAAGVLPGQGATSARRRARMPALPGGLPIARRGRQGTAAPGETWIEVPKDGEKRLDWTLRVRREGVLKIRVSAETAAESDATEMTFPVLVHGVERALTQSGALRQQSEEKVTVELPEARKPGSSELVVNLNPSLAATMLDALPYLADYPYGCIEQTMSRFLPTVVVAKTLRDTGYDLEALRRRARQLEERAKAPTPGAQPPPPSGRYSPYSYPQGRPGTIRFRPLAAPTRRRSPIFDAEALNQMVRVGLGRIRAARHDDGGWGWWPGDSSDPYMTAYVLYGLQVCRAAGFAVEPGMIEGGLAFLQRRFLEDDDFHRMAYMARVLAMDPGHREPIRKLAAGRVYERRERLSAYSKALLALALHDLGEKEKAEVLLRNVETTARVDAANGTASWDEGSGAWWHWYHNKVETSAAVLQASMAIRPQAEIAPMLVKWLVNNRRGNIWNSTRETAMAVYALTDYARVNRELDPEYTLTVDLGGRVRREYTVTRENALFFDNQFVVPDELLQTGKQALTIRKNGAGALYWSAHTRYFSLEEPIRAAAHEIAVRRRTFRLVPGTASGNPNLQVPLSNLPRPNPFLTGRYDLLTQGGEWIDPGDPTAGPRYERVALKEGETVTSGDLLEVELQLEAKNDYDYLVFEDMKPAGCEPVELRSGDRAGLGVCSYVEYRDEKVAFFVSSLPQGTRTLTYRLRAEIPGAFHVLPTNGYAMYAPDVRAISDEGSLTIRDAGRPSE